MPYGSDDGAWFMAERSTHAEVSVEHLDGEEAAVVDDGGCPVFGIECGSVELSGAVEEGGGVGEHVGHFVCIIK